MKTRWTRLVCRCGGRFLLHPADSIFHAYRDGELNSRQKLTIARHLQECAHCREVYAELADTLEWFTGHECKIRDLEIHIPADGYKRLEEAINSHVLNSPSYAGIADSAAWNEALKGRVVSELQIYLGDRIVQDLTSQVAGAHDVPRALLAKAEPFLATFLGEKAANLVRYKIVAAGVAT